MKKRGILARAGVLIVILVLMMSGRMPNAYAYDAEGQKVYDGAGLLSAKERRNLEEQCRAVAEKKMLDVVIVTTEDTQGKSAMEYADDFYDGHGFGYERARGTGILLLIDMGRREAYISTCGDAIYYFTDKRNDAMLDRIVPALSDGDYEKACDTFLSLVKSYMGRDPDAPPTLAERFRKTLRRCPVYLVIALIIAAVYANSLKKAQNTRRNVKNGVTYKTYQDRGAFNLVQRDDFFLREQVTSRYIPPVRPPEHGSGGGGSSTHTSSGGTSHGGGGRGF